MAIQSGSMVKTEREGERDYDSKFFNEQWKCV